MAGVGRPTASKVLNGKDNCWASEETRERIRAAALALGYRPNLSARALYSGQSRVIGLVSPGFAVSSTNSRPAGLTNAAFASDYTVTLSSHPNDSNSEDHVIRRLIDRAVDGMAVYPVDVGPHAELRRLIQQGYPVVTFDGAALLDFQCDDISADYIAIGRLQARHLLEVGRRRICIARALPEARINAIRNTGIQQELSACGAPPPLLMDIHRPAAEFEDAEAICDGIKAFVQQHGDEFDAVVSYDSVANLVIRTILKLGFHVPKDVAVIGAGDTILSTYGTIPLTSVCTRDAWAGEQAFELMMARLRTPRATIPFRRITSPAELVIRESTRPS